MYHARRDYQRFQDPLGVIPDDEPVFLIRGQDIVGAKTVRFWADQAEAHGASPRIVERAREHAALMESWATRKVPDMPA